MEKRKKENFVQKTGLVMRVNLKYICCSDIFGQHPKNVDEELFIYIYILYIYIYIYIFVYTSLYLRNSNKVHKLLKS
jgi:hypothetical protein